MVLKEKISSELAPALKSRNDFRAQTLRFLLASIHNREIEKRGKGDGEDLTEEEIIGVLSRETKRRKEAAEIYKKGGRPELESKELEELKIIKEFMPPEMDESEIKKIVSGAIQMVGAKDEKDFGRVMGEAMKQLKGRAESSLVNKIIKEFFEFSLVQLSVI